MKIITVSTPVFEWNDKTYIIETQRFKSRKPFKRIQQEVDNKEKNGMTHCFFFSTTNSALEKNMDEVEDTDGVTTVRWCFDKIDTSERKLGKVVSGIAKMLRGDEES